MNQCAWYKIKQQLSILGVLVIATCSPVASIVSELLNVIQQHYIQGFCLSSEIIVEVSVQVKYFGMLPRRYVANRIVNAH